jgi:hypothetical protein
MTTAKRNPRALLPLALALASVPLLGGCQGVLVGNLLVLAVTVGIFFGTLGLGRSASAATRSATGDGADRSQPQSPR